MWIPVEFWDDGDEVDEKRGWRRADVRRGRALEAELGEEDADVEMEMEVYGIRDVLEGWWRRLEKVGLVVQRKFWELEKFKELDDGHDGDL